MKDLEQKKKMLIAESEVCRQSLRLEIQNLRLFSVRTRQRFKGFGVPKQAWMLAAAGAFSLWGRRRARRRLSFWRLGGLGMVGWKLFQRVVPFCRGMFGRKAHHSFSHREGGLWHKKDISAA